MSQDVETWKSDLIEAGWVAVRWNVWKAPDGALHRGPYGAWCKMLAAHGMCRRCGGTGEEPGHVRDPDYGYHKCADCEGTGETEVAK
jgi:hypothetical protein